jgi:hypothetical protein
MAAPVIAMLAGAPSPVTVLLPLALAVAGFIDLAYARMRDRCRLVHADLTVRLAELRRFLAHDLLEQPTHGRLIAASSILLAARDRVGLGDQNGSDIRTLEEALATLQRLEHAIRDSGPVRRERRQAAGRSIARSEPSSALDSVLVTRLVRGPRTRDALARMSMAVSTVRRLHSTEIEWSVLVLTMWARLLFVALAPLMAGVSLGVTPLAHGWSARELPWLLAIVWSSATALAAPWLATEVMRHDQRGSALRRVLLVVEIPLAIAMIVATPSWPVALFAAGWTNWWQRPSFDLPRLLLWITLMLATLVGALAGQGVPPLAMISETAAAFVAIACIGDSYGAMLPLTLGVLGRVLFGRITLRHHARRAAVRALDDAVGQLLLAADLIDCKTPAADPIAACDAESLREIAGALALGSDRRDRRVTRAPLGLMALVDAALEKAAPVASSERAARLAERARLAGDPPPLTVLPATAYADPIPRLRFRRRLHARALSLLVVEVVQEARHHGTGHLVTRCHEQDGRVVLRFANVVRPGTSSGRGSGLARLERLASRLPGGSIDVRMIVDGSFIDLPPAARRFGVQVSLPASLLLDLRPVGLLSA